MKKILTWLISLLAMPVLALEQEARIIEFSYEIAPQSFPADRPVDVYIPLPANEEGQKVLVQDLQSSVAGSFGRDETFGNAYFHLHRPAGDEEPLSANLVFTVERQVVQTHGLGEITEDERTELLAPDALVPVDHEILQPILAEVRALRKDDSQVATARAIYDWVVDNVEYKKVGTGWGNGDTFWACNERYGNCTDFHALLISLARSEGIPARFEIGFPIPADATKGKIGGYHCWVQMYLPGQGWVPVDASEAAKHPQMREQLYGGQPADRILFTVGRDLVLSEGSSAAPLNYFIYPYVEVDGKPWTGKLTTTFRFRELPARANKPELATAP